MAIHAPRMISARKVFAWEAPHWTVTMATLAQKMDASKGKDAPFQRQRKALHAMMETRAQRAVPAKMESVSLCFSRFVTPSTLFVPRPPATRKPERVFKKLKQGRHVHPQAPVPIPANAIMESAYWNRALGPG